MATYLDLMFRDTIAGSMLRTLMLKRSMTQREFMRVYHERCGRADAKTKSSFGHNFGRFVAREQVWNRWTHGGQWIDVKGVSRQSTWSDRPTPLGCIEWHRPITGRDSSERMNRLVWCQPFVAETLLATSDNRTLDRIEQTLERVAHRGDSAESVEASLLLADVQRCMRVRAAMAPQRERAGAAVRKLYDAVEQGLKTVSFADWYWDGAELSTVKLRGKALTAWKAIRRLAESTDLTAGDYLEAYGIRWTQAEAA